MSELKHRYCLSSNDESIIKHHTDKPLSENARKTLTILSEVFGGLHHLDSDQLDLFDYQSTWYNQYLFTGSLSTWDFQNLTLLVIIAHDMAVRFEIQSTVLDKDDEQDMKLIQKQLDDCNSEYDYNLTVEQFMEEPRSYLRLLFHQRTRTGDISTRHPTLEDSMQGFRKGNKHYA